MPNWFSNTVNGNRTIYYGEADDDASNIGTTVWSGYGTGALDISNSATVTQSTNKATGVTANANSGQITTEDAALADDARATFTVSNSNVEATDIIGINYVAYGYSIHTTNIRNGAFDIIVTNRSGGSLSDAIVVRFVVISQN